MATVGAYIFNLPSPGFNNHIQNGNPWRNREIEEIGQRLVALGNDADPLAWWKFSRVVCSWGRGMRVWANYNRRHNADMNNPNQEIGAMLKNGFLEAMALDTPTGVMDHLLNNNALRGFHISYLSKHLRMLQPTQYAVLDSVLVKNTGFACNKNGYGLFMNSLHNQIADARQQSGLEFHVSDFEAAIFLLAGGGAGENNVPQNHVAYLNDARASVGLQQI